MKSPLFVLLGLVLTTSLLAQKTKKIKEELTYHYQLNRNSAIEKEPIFYIKMSYDKQGRTLKREKHFIKEDSTIVEYVDSYQMLGDTSLKTRFSSSGQVTMSWKTLTSYDTINNRSTNMKIRDWKSRSQITFFKTIKEFNKDSLVTRLIDSTYWDNKAIVTTKNHFYDTDNRVIKVISSESKSNKKEVHQKIKKIEYLKNGDRKIIYVEPFFPNKKNPLENARVETRIMDKHDQMISFQLNNYSMESKNTYDKKGNLIKSIQTVTAGENTTKYVYENKYNSFGDIIKKRINKESLNHYEYTYWN